MAKRKRITPTGGPVRPVVASRRNEKVMLAYPYGEFEGAFVTSLVMCLVYDAHHGQHIINGGYFLPLETTNIPHGRNQIVRTFLDETTADWLWFIDTDQRFDADVLERMLAAADPDDRPILGALVFSFSRGDAQEIVPTLWTIDDGQIARIMQVPDAEAPIPLAATGTGCVLIHRKVLEAVRDMPIPGQARTYGETSWPWFQYSDWIADGKPDVMGEDLTFFLRATAAGYVTHVDPRIEVGHVKRKEIGRAEYDAQPLALGAIPNFVVIPVKGHHGLTDGLVAELLAQGECDGIFILDNGADTDPYPNRHGVHVLNATGLNIHQMWNLGVDCCVKGSPRCNVAILNNDLEVGPGFLSGLARQLRTQPRCLAVSPNYDRRFGSGFAPVRGICANRYDGTGGLAGFAFMIPGEMFAAGFPAFDEQLAWWYGDNDFTLNLDRYNAVYGIALDVTCTHLDGGSVTARGADLEQVIAADRAYFTQKWSS